ncbi:MAG: hypothetical protein M1826_001040 [Phylliscum demangeonii]|nr:MAG: hypothetical protein M1826_001040 [Phylliscum demangeonii]
MDDYDDDFYSDDYSDWEGEHAWIDDLAARTMPSPVWNDDEAAQAMEDYWEEWEDESSLYYDRSPPSRTTAAATAATAATAPTAKPSTSTREGQSGQSTRQGPSTPRKRARSDHPSDAKRRKVKHEEGTGRAPRVEVDDSVVKHRSSVRPPTPPTSTSESAPFFEKVALLPNWKERFPSAESRLVREEATGHSSSDGTLQGDSKWQDPTSLRRSLHLQHRGRRAPSSSRSAAVLPPDARAGILPSRQDGIMWDEESHGKRPRELITGGASDP